MEFFKADKPVFHTATKAQFAHNKSKRHIACELEIARAEEGCEITDTVRKWQGAIVADGSLPASGFEICTSPANGDLFIEQIEAVCEALNEQDAEVNSACGFHVHIDARDFTYWDVRKLILLYAKIEDALFSVCPPSRRASSYCQPCGVKFAAGLDGWKTVKKQITDNIYGGTLKTVEGKMRGERLKRLRTEKYHDSRYHALNLHSWVFRGTVECRMAAGTVSSTKVINWALLWAGILDYAMAHSETEIRKLTGSSWSVLQTVAPTDAIRNWLIARREKFGSSCSDD